MNRVNNRVNTSFIKNNKLSKELNDDLRAIKKRISRIKDKLQNEGYTPDIIKDYFQTKTLLLENIKLQTIDKEEIINEKSNNNRGYKW